MYTRHDKLVLNASQHQREEIEDFFRSEEDPNYALSGNVILCTDASEVVREVRSLVRERS